jgi:phosphate acyltransferase
MPDGQSFMQKKSDPLPLPCIGIDLLGSDAPSDVVLESLLPTIDSLRHSAKFVLYCEESNLPAIQAFPYLSYQVSTEAILMNENPLWAIRRKKNSSLFLGIRALKEKTIHAFISMGNTGALMAAAKTALKTLPSISRPALLTLLPTKNNEIAVLDVGANTACKSSHFLEFAAMGIAYQKSRGIQNPTVGLLNIGAEPIKGTPELRSAYRSLSSLNDRLSYRVFKGNVEGRDVIDVLVTDGFTGNIFLKTAEGIAGFLLDQLKEYSTHPYVLSSLARFQNRLDYSEYPGAVLCGVSGIVIKCHGTAKSQALHHSIISAIHLMQQGFLEKIKTELTAFF